ncbi:hypothetical protein PP935_gp240 [Rhizobium phage RHph_N34]|uniref:Uncharacterized protein n=1 Tax=Rhizobium phage RHph_N34 TaxID=2509586 RepID=A0A7S5RAB9_9CAUD|nr:hypothetical protein PP935_gp240 [Rhizobium phage RHph_N34]QIG74015.1 hypothetical protein EVC06_240 [Rhizobium phage RHph_N34]
MTDQNEEKDRFEMQKMCISCRHYSSGHNECRRFPPVPVKYMHVQWDGYNKVEFEDLAWMYPHLQVDHPKCGEHVLEPKFR